jgi:transcriptional regulator with XRE-family HTH domain
MNAAYVALPYLIAWRHAAYLSQKQLAEQAGLSKYTVMSIEKGRYRASYRTIRAIAEALHITPRQLIEEEPA